MHWLAIRKEEALKIDPETAEVYCTYAQTLDGDGQGGRAGSISGKYAVLGQRQEPRVVAWYPFTNIDRPVARITTESVVGMAASLCP